MQQGLDQRLTNCRVLVAEDEFFIADDLVKALRRAGAIPLGPVSTTVEAEAALRSGDVDAAILDVNLRGIIADKAIKRAKAMKLPCLVVSGYSKVALPPAVRKLPRLEKPIDTEKVVAALAEQVSKNRKVSR